jgi:hypothetical protein
MKIIDLITMVLSVMDNDDESWFVVSSNWLSVSFVVWWWI